MIPPALAQLLIVNFFKHIEAMKDEYNHHLHSPSLAFAILSFFLLIYTQVDIAGRYIPTVGGTWLNRFEVSEGCHDIQSSTFYGTQRGEF